jgi:Kef-type K+ transport system membrane component KefB/voltage-gated potassium channel Kch
LVFSIWYFVYFPTRYQILATIYQIPYTDTVERIFFEITIIICLAAGLTIIFRHYKQPAILAYLLTGIILGPLGIFQLQEKLALETLGQLGITLLLFMLGLELKLNELRSIGKVAVLVGGAQMLITLALGYGTALLLGFSPTGAIYTGLALAFSSTIIIVKILSDKKDLNSLHGKLAIGILLMQDFFAVMTIIFLTGVSSVTGSALITQIGIILLKIVVLFGWVIVLSKYLFPPLVKRIAKSHESLFLFSLAWVFALTALIASPYIGFSIEIGGFLAGLALANTSENFQIIAKMKALRDFFITIFFVVLGLEMSIHNVSQVLLPAIILILFVIFLKPLIIMVITGALGYRKRTSFLVGLSLSQISEFSFLILFIGTAKGAIPAELDTMFLIVGITTFATSTFALQNSNKLYKLLSNKLYIFERNNIQKNHIEAAETFEDLEHHIILVGGHEMGMSIIKALEDTNEPVVVVDFDPDVVQRLREKDIPVLFGDIADTEIQERVHFNKARLVISTVPDIEDNLLLIKGLNKANRRAKIVVMSLEAQDTKELYDAGADYVVMPHLAGGRHLAKILIDKKHMELIEKYKEKDLSDIS